MSISFCPDLAAWNAVETGANPHFFHFDVGWGLWLTWAAAAYCSTRSFRRHQCSRSFYLHRGHSACMGTRPFPSFNTCSVFGMADMPRSHTGRRMEDIRWIHASGLGPGPEGLAVNGSCVRFLSSSTPQKRECKFASWNRIRPLHCSHGRRAETLVAKRLMPVRCSGGRLARIGAG